MRRKKIAEEASRGADAATELRGTFRMLARRAVGDLSRERLLEVLDGIDAGLDDMKAGIATIRAHAEEADVAPPDGTPVPRGLVLDAVERMAAELTIYLPADHAAERARNIAQALGDGRENPEEAVIEALSGVLADHPFRERVLAITRTRDAWLEATRSAAPAAPAGRGPRG